MMAASSEKLAEAAGQLDSAIAEDSGFVEAIRARQGVAVGLGDANGMHRMAVLAARHEDRLPELERLADEIRNVDSLGESTRADALSGELVARFPHDPRAYSARADLLTAHGRWADAEAVLSRELALDSLAMVAGDGPCTPCEVLWRLSQVRLAKSDRVGAEASARRWVALQPDLPAAWRNLSATLAAVGKSAEAAEAGYHDVALSRNALAAVDFARTMLSARRYDIVDSLLHAWRHTSDPVLLDGTRDIGIMLDRERGRIAESVAALADLPRGQRSQSGSRGRARAVGSAVRGARDLRARRTSSGFVAAGIHRARGARVFVVARARGGRSRSSRRYDARSLAGGLDRALGRAELLRPRQGAAPSRSRRAVPGAGPLRRRRTRAGRRRVVRERMDAHERGTGARSSRARPPRQRDRRAPRRVHGPGRRDGALRTAHGARLVDVARVRRRAPTRQRVASTPRTCAKHGATRIHRCARGLIPSPLLLEPRR